MGELKNCPFCAHHISEVRSRTCSKIDETKTEGGDSIYYFECLNCQAKGPPSLVSVVAMDKWNARQLQNVSGDEIEKKTVRLLNSEDFQRLSDLEKRVDELVARFDLNMASAFSEKVADDFRVMEKRVDLLSEEISEVDTIAMDCKKALRDEMPCKLGQKLLGKSVDARSLADENHERYEQLARHVGDQNTRMADTQKSLEIVTDALQKKFERVRDRTVELHHEIQALSSNGAVSDGVIDGIMERFERVDDIFREKTESLSVRINGLDELRRQVPEIRKTADRAEHVSNLVHNAVYTFRDALEDHDEDIPEDFGGRAR